MRRMAGAVMLATLPAVLLGVAVRVWVVFNDAPLCASQGAVGAAMCIGPTNDTTAIGTLAAGLGRGRGFADPMQQQTITPRATAAPVLPTVLAGADLMGFSDLQAMRAFGGAVGALAAVGVGGVALALDRRAGAVRPAVATVAGVAVAIAPFWVIDAVTLRPELLLVSLVAALLWRLATAGDGRSIRAAAIDGALMGVVTLTRADGVLIAAVFLCGIVVHFQLRSGSCTAFRGLLLRIATASLLTAPWLLFNVHAGHGLIVSERGVFDAIPSNFDPIADWGSLPLLGLVLRVGLLLLAGLGVFRRWQRGQVVWPFGLFVAVSGALVLLVGVSSGPLVPFDVATVVLSASVVVDVFEWGSARLRALSAAFRMRRPWAVVSTRMTLLAGLLLIVLFSAGVRLWIVNVQRPECVERVEPIRADQCWQLAGDAQVFVATARSVSNGDGFVVDGYQSASHPPMFTLLLAGVNLTGSDDIGLRRNMLALVGAAGVGVLTVASYRLACRAALPSLHAAAWTGGIAAVYPAFWLNEAMLYSESLLLLTGGVLVLVGGEFFYRPSSRWAVALGGALAIAVLTRAEVVVIALPIAITYLLAGARVQQLKSHAVHMMVVALVATALLAPWAQYNRSRYSKPVLMTTTPGVTLVEVTCDEVFYGELLGYYDLRCIPAIGLTFDESIADERYQAVAAQYLRRNAGRYPVQIVAAIGRSSELYRPGHNANLSAWLEGRGFAASFTALFFHLFLLPFALVGTLMLRRRKVPLGVFAGTVLSAVVAVAFIGAIARVRLMADISLVMLAGLGLASLHQFLQTDPKEAA